MHHNKLGQTPGSAIGLTPRERCELQRVSRERGKLTLAVDRLARKELDKLEWQAANLRRFLHKRGAISGVKP